MIALSGVGLIAVKEGPPAGPVRTEALYGCRLQSC